MKTKLFSVTLTLFTAMLFAQDNTFVHQATNNTEIILLSEGQGNGNSGILLGATSEMLKKTMPEGSYPNATNAFLVRTQGKNVLIDAGYGRELLKNLRQNKVTPDKIDAIFITHMHGDHIGGLLDADQKKIFPNASLYLSKAEYEHYSNPKTRGNDAANAVFSAYRDKLVVFNAGEKILNNWFETIACYGHTPGHTAYLIDNTLIWGDITHAMAIQMPYPQIAVSYDSDSKQAITSRQNILKSVVDKKWTVAGMHIAYPGMGTLKSNGENGYLFTPLK